MPNPVKGFEINGQVYKIDYTAMDNLPPGSLPIVSQSDFGKFLRVNSSGVWEASMIPSAEGGSF